MKKEIAIFVFLATLITLTFSCVAFAEGGIGAIHIAADEADMEAAMRDTAELSEESIKLDGLDIWTKESLIDSVFRRRNHCATIAEFKKMFDEQYVEKTTYMKWVSGYPSVESVGDNGATLVVKTDIDGWVYITSFGDDVSGGLSDEYSFMKFYNADNGQYKIKVWVQGGIETKIGVSSSSWANGKIYRIYYCLRNNGNESGFGHANFTAPKFWYTLEMVRSALGYDTDGPSGYEEYYYYDYYFYLTSSHDLLYEAIHEYPFWETGDYFYDFYTVPDKTVEIDFEFTADFEVGNYVYTRVTNQAGQQYYDDFELPGPDVP